ncbi:MAG: hypothetical protein SGPRY_002057 [Prymnesium sp.]
MGGVEGFEDDEGSRGLAGAEGLYAGYIAQEDAIIQSAVVLAELLLQPGRPVSFENPPDVTVVGMPWSWPAMRHTASLWVMPQVQRLQCTYGLLAATAPMCAFGSEYLKYFTLLASPSQAADLSELSLLVCSREGRHACHAPARGRTADGQSRSALAGRYPRALNVWLLWALFRASQEGNAGLPPETPGVSPCELGSTSDAAS